MNFSTVKNIIIPEGSVKSITIGDQVVWTKGPSYTYVKLIERTLSGEYTNNNLTSIGDYAFYNLDGLTAINAPAVTSIGYAAFDDCGKLATVNMPAVITIGDYAFYKCSALPSVDFPVATSIGAYAFESCSKLAEINFPLAQTIGSQAFYYCTGLTNVDFPSVTYINSYAFSNCRYLETVNLPVVNGINKYAFYYCSSLKTIDLPVATAIGSYAFQYSGLETLILRNTEQICTLTNTNSLSGTPIASGEGYIYVPSALVDSYKADSVWANYANQIRAIEDYPEVTGGNAA